MNKLIALSFAAFLGLSVVGCAPEEAAPPVTPAVPATEGTTPAAEGTTPAAEGTTSAEGA